MKIKSVLSLVKKHLLGLLIPSTFFIALVRTAYHYINKTETPPWDSDLIIVITKGLWFILAFPLSGFLLLVILVVYLAIKLFKNNKTQGVVEKFLFEYENLFWIIGFRKDDSFRVVGPVCPEHYHRLVEVSGLRPSYPNSSQRIKCDIPGCNYDSGKNGTPYSQYDRVRTLVSDNPNYIKSNSEAIK